MGAVYTRTTHREPLRLPEADPRLLLEAYFHLPTTRPGTPLVLVHGLRRAVETTARP